MIPELQFARMILHLVAAMAFLSLATMGDWRKSASSRVYAGVAIYFLGASVRLLFVSMHLEPTTISDYWLTPALVLVVIFAWWAAYRSNRQVLA
jgi:hypothetical protein